jgi:dihydropteroate synthase
MQAAAAAGVGEEQILLDPARTSRRRPPRRSRCCGALDGLHALGRPLLLPVSRKDFLGAITGRAAARPRRRHPRRVGWAADAGAHVLRVHDVEAAADFLAVRAVLRGDRVARPPRRSDTGPLPGRHAASVRRNAR